MCCVVADDIEATVCGSVAACAVVTRAVQVAASSESGTSAVALAQPLFALTLYNYESPKAVADDVYPHRFAFGCWCAVSPVLHVVAVAEAESFDWLAAVLHLARIVIHVVPLPWE
jgi:hypothetical protein